MKIMNLKGVLLKCISVDLGDTSLTQVLDLSQNDIGDTKLFKEILAHDWSQVQVLRLSDNKLQTDIIKILVDTHMPALELETIWIMML